MGVAVLTLLIACTYLPFTGIPWRAWAALAGVGAIGLAGVWMLRARATTSRSASSTSSIRRAIRSRRATRRSSRRSRSARAVSSARATSRAPQTQLRFLPTQHSDFVFSVLAEEWGFVGSVLVLALYLGAPRSGGSSIARNSKDGFGAMLAVGVVGLLFWPVVINVAMVLGLAPVIGVPFPLLSYGGSSLLAALIGLGLLLNVSMRRYMF